MTEQGWPLLISRRRDVDYVVVVVPRFLSDSPLVPRLLKHFNSEPTAEPLHVTIDAPDGPLNISYRVVPAEVADETFKDPVGRPIVWIEGVVIRKPGITELLDPTKDLQTAHEQLIDDFRAFWNGSPHPKSSDPFPVEVKGTGDGPGRGGIVLAGVLSALLVGWLVLRPEAKPPQPSTAPRASSVASVTDAGVGSDASIARADAAPDATIAKGNANPHPKAPEALPLPSATAAPPAPR